jgi:dTMP kinase
MKGKFITFEGSEGCGKSTQSKLLYQYLKNKGYAVVYLREPGTTAISENIRGILLNPKNNIASACEMLLYMAAHAEVVDKIIKPALSKGKLVICDRFLDSTIAYQGFGLSIDIDFIKAVGGFICDGIKPDLTLLLDLPVKKGLRHRKNTQDRIEKRPYAYHVRVRRGYLKLVASEPERIKIVKVDRDKLVTRNRIRKLVDRFLCSEQSFAQGIE